MRRHPIALAAIVLVTATLFGVALFVSSTYLAVAAVLLGVVTAFILGIAWMRPRGYPIEHHPKMDELFDDTAP